MEEGPSEPGTGPAQPGLSLAGKGVEHGGWAGIPERGWPSSTLQVWSAGHSKEAQPALGWSPSYPAGAQGSQQGTWDSPR